MVDSVAAPITNYDTLQTAIAGYLNREDITTEITTFIQLAHAKFNRSLRTRDMHVRAEASTDDEFIALPTDYLQDYSLQIVQGNVWSPPLKFVGQDEAASMRAALVTNTPRYYAIFGDNFEMLPTPNATTDYVLRYYGQIPALSVANSTNWLITKSPDLYLYSSLLEAAPFLKNDERLQMWASVRQSLLDDIALESERSVRSSVQVNARRRGF